MIGNIFCKAQEWINLFVSLGNTYIGYRRCNVTPFVHAMVYHLSKFLETYKTYKVLRKSSNWDAAADVSKLESMGPKRERTYKEIIH
jgi:hypothetical protein